MLTLEVILNQVRTGVRSPLNAPHQPNLVEQLHSRDGACNYLQTCFLPCRKVWAAKRHTQSLNLLMGYETPCSIPHR